MAHFRGTVSGNAQTVASRLGSKKSGLLVHANGWNFGVFVLLYHDSASGKDKAVVYQTGGSNGHKTQKVLAEIEEE